MTTSRIREALLEVRDAVDVPVVDEVAFRQHLRRARRHRDARRVAVAAATLAAVALGPVIWLGRPAGSPPPGPATRPSAPAGATALAMVPVSLGGRLETVLPDGAGYSTRDRVEEVLGSGPAGVVAIGRDSHLLLVPLGPGGRPAQPRDLGDGRPVQRAWLDKSGQYVGFVDLEHHLHLRAVGSDQDLASSALTPADELLAVDATRWLTGRADTITVHTATGSVDLESAATPLSAEVAGATVAYETPDSVEFFDSADGSRRADSPGISLGSLSPDGARYVGAAGEQQVDTGASLGWYLIDTRTGERQLFPGRPPRAHAVSMTWQDDDRFLVVATDRRQPGNRIVSDCSVATQQCVERYNDPGDTLALATR